MSAKKLVIAMVICYAVLVGTSWLIHEVWLMNDYAATPDSWRLLPDMQQKMWVMFVGQAFFAAMFCYIYSRGAESKPWLAQGVRYGVVMTLLTVIPFSLGEYTVYRVPHMLAVKWMAAGLVQMILLGLIVAGIGQKRPA
jgi:hypothetical protein